LQKKATLCGKAYGEEPQSFSIRYRQYQTFTNLRNRLAKTIGPPDSVRLQSAKSKNAADQSVARRTIDRQLSQPSRRSVLLADGCGRKVGSRPFIGINNPVERHKWDDAAVFSHRLSEITVSRTIKKLANEVSGVEQERRKCCTRMQ
jgi:hypothetical protein